MKKIFTLFLLAIAPVAIAFAQSDVQVIEKKVDFYTVPIQITGDAQVTGLANHAFQSHGRFLRVASGGNYTFRFTQVSGTQVRVDVTKKDGSTVISQTASGSNLNDATLRAADIAAQAAGAGKGWFASRLAFVSTRTGASEVYVSDLYLNELTQVTNQRAHVLSPRWAPGGGKLIYTSYFKSGFPDIFQIDLRAGRWTTFASFQGTNMSARYSPDGSRVVMVLSGKEGKTNVYVTGADGAGRPTQLTTTDTTKSSPCFSPDGRRIVFAMEPGPQLYVMNAGGGTPTRVGTSSGYSAEPDWNRANPNLIAFTTRVGRDFRVAVHDLSSGKTRVIQPKNAAGQNLGGDFIEASWLADGRHVVCTMRTSNQRALYILDTEEQSGNRATKISAIYACMASALPPQ